MNDDAGASGRTDGAEGRPFFSFLTTAYRSEDTLPRTVRSVLAQSRSDWEMVVVDNGMSDSIVAAVEPFLSDPRIHLVRQENKGPIGGAMAAAAAASGRYLVVLNSDDTITPDFCAVTGRVLETEPGIAAVTPDAVVIDVRDGSALPRSYLQNAGLRGAPDPSRKLRPTDIIDGPCPYYTAPIRRDVWDEQGGMASDNALVGDLDFWLRVTAAGHDVRMIPDRLGVYYVAAGSSSRPVDPLKAEVVDAQREAVLARAAEASGRPEDLEALARVRRRLNYQREIRRARTALLGGSVAEARTHVRQAYAARKTARAAALIVALQVSPSLLVRAHPAKQAVQERVGDHARRLRTALVRRRR